MNSMSRAADSNWWFDLFKASPVCAQLQAELERGGELTVRGAVGCSTTVLVAAMASLRPQNGPYVLLVPHLDDAEEAIEELGDLGARAHARRAHHLGVVARRSPREASVWLVWPDHQGVDLSRAFSLLHIF